MTELSAHEVAMGDFLGAITKGLTALGPLDRQMFLDEFDHALAQIQHMRPTHPDTSAIAAHYADRLRDSIRLLLEGTSHDQVNENP